MGTLGTCGIMGTTDDDGGGLVGTLGTVVAGSGDWYELVGTLGTVEDDGCELAGTFVMVGTFGTGEESLVCGGRKGWLGMV